MTPPAPIRGGMMVFVIRREFGYADAGGRWYVRQRRVFGVRENGTITYRENGQEMTANPIHVFRNRALAHQAALNANFTPVAQ